MKHILRISILMLLLGAYASAAVPQVPAPDGGMIGTHPGLQIARK
jgi:hypothetical protein